MTQSAQPPLFTVRSSQGDDAVVCAQIIRDWGDETPWLPPLDEPEPMAAWWRNMLVRDTAWVAEKQGAVVGFCVRCDDNITGLYVAGPARNFGVGKALLDQAKADRDWITVWAYAANTNAFRFYRREGLIERSRETEADTGLVDVEHRWTRPA